MSTLRIGTRGSNLALIQARKVKEALLAAYPDIGISVETISTKGDRITNIPLHHVQATGVFVKELEQALLEGKIDIAVHSLKDMPSNLPAGLIVSSVLSRDDPRDALLRPLGTPGASLKGNETVGTSSLRRKAQLLGMYPGLEIVDIRGNIETRLAKLDEGLCDATILAACGMDRAGYQDRIAYRFPVAEMLPAACQGIIAIEQRVDDSGTHAIVESIIHQYTFIRAAAEREFLRSVQGGCRVPVGCYSEIEDGTIIVEGMVASEDGSVVIRHSVTGSIAEAEALARRLAVRVLDDGGKEILESYEH